MKPERVIHKIVRADISTFALYGYVLATSKTKMLIAEENEFVLNGYKILRRRDITLREVNDSQRYTTQIMEQVNLLASIDWEVDIPLDSWEGIFRWLQARDKFVFLADADDEILSIGPITEVHSDEVRVHYFTPTGEWGDIETVAYEDIATVTFDDRYTTVHSRYLPLL